MRFAERVRYALKMSLAVSALVVSLPAGALELRVAAWNLEHLAGTNDEGCVGRDDADYIALAERIDALGVDVLAFQEVENAAAAERGVRRGALERGDLLSDVDRERASVP